MHLALNRLVVTVLATFGLAACAGHATLPGTTQSILQQPLSARTSAFSTQWRGSGSFAAASSCNVSGAWYFRGTCVAFTVKPAGMTTKMRAYKGIALTFGLPANNAPANTTFVFGDGTSDADITGTLNGAKFPLYGKVPCFDIAKNTTTKCLGKGLVYVMALDASSNAVQFAQTPSIVVTAKKFPGTKQCQVDIMGSVGSQSVWGLLPIYAKPKHGKASFKSYAFPLPLNADSFVVLGFSCH